MRLIRISPESFAGNRLPVFKTPERVPGPPGKRACSTASDDDLETFCDAVEDVDPGGVERAKVDRAVRQPFRFGTDSKNRPAVEIGRRRLIQDVDLDALDRLLRAIVNDDPAHVTRLRRC